LHVHGGIISTPHILLPADFVVSANPFILRHRFFLRSLVRFTYRKKSLQL